MPRVIPMKSSGERSDRPLDNEGYADGDTADSHRNISFDIFDTLLIRPYARPDDLFTHIEINEKRKGFARERRNAERRARRKICHEITFDEIYDEISPEYHDLKNIELEYEMQVMRSNPDVLEMFNSFVANSNKVVLISDMYLPKEFILKLLEKNGISGFDGLYLSCEYRESKRKGKLFSIALSDMGISPQELLHIGDNYVSDHKVPTSMGIDCILIEKHIDNYLQLNRKAKRIKGNAELSILAGMDSVASLRNERNAAEDDDWWYRFGYRYGGPISVMFAQFINEHADDGVVLFAARDGYVPMNVFDLMFASDRTDLKDRRVTSEYVFAFRLFYIAFCDDVTPRYAHYILNYFADHPEVVNIERSENAYETYVQHKGLFDRLRMEEMNSYRKYVQNLVGDRNVYVADMTTMKYSSQKLIQEALGNDSKVIGLYYNAMSDSTECKHVAFNDHRKSISNWSRTNMTEFLMSSPDPPAIGMDSGCVIYSKDNPDCEVYRSRVSKDIIKGCVDYAADIKEMFGERIPRISYSALSKWLDLGIKHLSRKESEHIHSIFWASGADHGTYRRAVLSMKDIPYYLKSKASEFIFNLRKE